MLVDEFALNLSARAVADRAVDAELRGFDGMWVTEAAGDALIAAAAALRSTSTIRIGTAVALAFSRSPMAVAYAAWDLAELSNGRFALGLGSGAREQIEDRFAMSWSAPVPRMRDYILAVRATWDAWRQGRELRYEGTHFRLVSMHAPFVPAAHDHALTLMLGAVGPKMTELAGELADGVVLHPLTTPESLERLTLPALERGLARSGRTRADVTLLLPLFTTASRAADAERRAIDLRHQIAWYASRSVYRPLFDVMGRADVAHRIAAADGSAARVELVDDGLLDAVSIDTDSDPGATIRARFGGQVDRIAAYYGWPLDTTALRREVQAT